MTDVLLWTTAPCPASTDPDLTKNNPKYLKIPQIFVKSRADGWRNIPVFINSLLLACPIKQEEQLITTRDGTIQCIISNIYFAMETDYLRQNNDTIVTAVTESDMLKIIEWFYAVIDKCLLIERLLPWPLILWTASFLNQVRFIQGIVRPWEYLQPHHFVSPLQQMSTYIGAVIFICTP